MDRILFHRSSRDGFTLYSLSLTPAEVGRKIETSRVRKPSFREDEIVLYYDPATSCFFADFYTPLSESHSVRRYRMGFPTPCV